MKYVLECVTVFSLVLLVSIGCSGRGGGRSPIEPPSQRDTSDQLGVTASRVGAPSSHCRLPLGLWDVAYNPETGVFDAVPLRQAVFHANAVGQVDAHHALSVETAWETPSTGEFGLDITIEHPFPNTHFRGFDVRGIVFGSGPHLLSSKDDPDLLWFALDGLRLVNADGWTRWWNPTEFTTPGPFGYTPGEYGKEGFVCSATLNPYKYYASVLKSGSPVVPHVNSYNRGTFATDEGPVTRRYDLVFPMVAGSPDMTFQYALDASWAPPTGGGSVPDIEHFPPEANCPEAYHIAVDASESTLYYSSESVNGGDLILEIEVFDWGAAVNGIDAEIKAITIESDTLFDEVVPVDVHGEPGTSCNSGIYCITVEDVHVHSPDDSAQEVLVTVISQMPTAYAPPEPGPVYPSEAQLAAYTLASIDVDPMASWPPLQIENVIETEGDAVDVETQGGLAHILDSVAGLVLFGVVNPKSPVELRTVPLPGEGKALDVENGYAYVIDANADFQVIDVNPVDIAGVVHTVGLSGNLTSIDVDGNYAYVGDESGSITILDIGSPDEAYVLNSTTISGPGPLNDIKARDGYLFVAADSLEILDVQDPLDPGVVTLVDISSVGRAVEVWDGGYAFVGNSSNELLVVDITPVDLAAVVETLVLDYPINDIMCSGELAYMTVSQEGLIGVIYHESSGEVHQVVQGYSAKDDPDALSIDSNLAYLGGEGSVEIMGLWFEYPPDGWARMWGGPDNDAGYSVAADSEGNLYVTGFFYETVDFDPGPDEDWHTSKGSDDVFLSKFDSDGEFLWSRTWGGTGLDESNFGEGAVAVDSLDDVYVTGWFWGTADFDPGPGITKRTSHGADDVFLSKFDSEGEFLWVRAWGGTGDDRSYGITIDSAGMIHVAGSFEGTVDFNPGYGPSDYHASHGSADVFVSTFDVNSSYRGVRTWGGPGSDAGIAVGVDPSRNPFVLGNFSGAVDFDPAGGEVHESNGLHDIFMSKFDSSGHLLWTRTWGGSLEDGAKGIALDGYGNAYSTGFFSDSADFDPGPGADVRIANGKHDAFVSALDRDGVFRWAGTWGGVDPADELGSQGKGITVDGAGYVYVTGCFVDTADFDPAAGEAIRSSNGREDASLTKFDSLGDFLWTRAWGASESDKGYSVTVDKCGAVYTAGSFWTIVDFDPGYKTDFRFSYHWNDAFLMKVMPDGYW